MMGVGTVIRLIANIQQLILYKAANRQYTAINIMQYRDTSRLDTGAIVCFSPMGGCYRRGRAVCQPALLEPWEPAV
jgi:hypothetical protein